MSKTRWVERFAHQELERIGRPAARSLPESLPAAGELAWLLVDCAAHGSHALRAQAVVEATKGRFAMVWVETPDGGVVRLRVPLRDLRRRAEE